MNVHLKSETFANKNEYIAILFMALKFEKYF